MTLPPGLQRLGVVLAALVALAAAMVLGLLAFLHSPSGERWAVARIERDLPGLAIEGFSLAWPLDVSAATLTMTDREGPWLTVEEFRLDWAPSRLWRRTFHIHELTARQAVVHRLPAAMDGEMPSFRLPDLLLRVEAVSVPIVLEPAVLGEPVRLDLSGTSQARADGGDVDVRLRAERGGIARVEGTVGTDFVDLRWYIEAPRLDRWSRLAGVRMGGDLNANGFVSGRLPSPVITVSGDVTRGHVDDLSWKFLEVSGRAIPVGGMWQAGIRATMTEPAASVGKSLPSQAEFSGIFDLTHDGRIRIGSARLLAGATDLAVSGVLSNWGRRADLRFAGEIGHLEQVAPFAGLPFAGKAKVAVTVSGDVLRPSFRAGVRVMTDGFVSGDAVLDRLLGAKASGRVMATVNGGGVRLDHVEIAGGKASATGLGTVWPRLDLRGRVEVGDLSVLVPFLSGAGVAHGRVAGHYDDPAAWGVAQVRDVTTGDFPAASGEAGFDFTRLAEVPVGTVTAHLSMAGRPVEGSARVEAGNPIRILDLLLRSGATRLGGDLTIGEGVGGRLRLSLPDLAEWYPGLAGAIEAEAVLDSANRQSTQVRAKGWNLTGMDVAAEEANLTVAVRGLDDKPQGTATLMATRVSRGAIALDRLAARAEGDLASFRFELDGTGGQTALTVRGTTRIDGPRGDGELAALAVRHQGIEARLAQLVQVRWGPQALRLEPAAVTVGGGRIEASGEIVEGRIAAGARLHSVPLEIARVLGVTDAVGTVSGRVTAGGSFAQPSVAVDLTGQGVGLAWAGTMDAAMRAQWEAGRLAGEASARKGDRLQVEVAGEGPVPLRDDGQVSARIGLTGDFGAITEVLPLSGHVFAGRLAGEASVAGTVAAPRIDGSFRLNDGRYENLDFGTLIASLEGEARIRGHDATIEARGGDGRKGSLRLEGQGTLGGEEPSWRAGMVASRFRAVRRDDMWADLSADLVLSGTGRDGRLAGQAKVERAEVDIAHLQGAGPVKLQVIEVNRPGEDRRIVVPTPKEAALPVEAMSLALAIDLAVERMFVRGRGLDSEWDGRLEVDGTLSAPRLAGSLRPERGRYTFLGKQFELTKESQVRFDPAEGATPRLDVVAVAQAGDIVARVGVTGTPQSPNLEITSEPPLPRDEVLSRVLFGTEPGSLSAFQQIQLAQLATGGLTGAGDGFDPIGGIRGALGLDVLEVGSAENGETRRGRDQNGGGPAVKAGKYIGDNTFLRVEQGMSGLGAVILEREVGGGLSITTELGQQAGGGVGVEWRRNY